jgi:hypothetical protein
VDVLAAIGWAVIADTGFIYLPTVSNTRRAAQVNYLYTECHLTVYKWESDEEVEARWLRNCRGVQCRKVVVTPDRLRDITVKASRKSTA